MNPSKIGPTVRVEFYIGIFRDFFENLFENQLVEKFKILVWCRFKFKSWGFLCRMATKYDIEVKKKDYT